MSIGHAHEEHFHARNAGNQKRLLFTLILTAAYMVCEFIGGIMSGSLSLLADASHMTADVAALVISMMAMWIAKKPATATKTYGYYRMEILAALANGSMLVLIAFFIIKEAIERFSNPTAINGTVMMVVAIGGLAVNIIGLITLHSSKDSSLNMHGAWLHIFSDMLGSIGVIISGIIIGLTGWVTIDPIISIIIASLVIYSSWSLIKETVSILMESAPRHIDPDKVRNALMSVPGVYEVHQLHIWTITRGLEAISVHVMSDNSKNSRELLADLQHVLDKQFNLTHATIQIET